ncbi:hypothetical protein M5689_020783 [Euphorbia peplus]|nr:hypothetical protein M5689_020783 [Euphorbia peplus]
MSGINSASKGADFLAGCRARASPGWLFILLEECVVGCKGTLVRITCISPCTLSLLASFLCGLASLARLSPRVCCGTSPRSIILFISALTPLHSDVSCPALL